MNTLKSLRNYMLPALTAIALAVVIGGAPASRSLLAEQAAAVAAALPSQSSSG